MEQKPRFNQAAERLTDAINTEHPRPPERFEVFDIRTYERQSFDSAEKALAHADELGVVRFDAVRIGHGTREKTAHIERVDGEWTRAGKPFAEGQRQADQDKLAGIKGRGEQHEDAYLFAKKPTLEALGNDTNARLAEIHKRDVEVISPEVAAKWAEIDAREIRTIQDPQAAKDAAEAIADNARNNLHYNRALAEKAPDVAELVAAVQEQNQQTLDAKADRKAADMAMMGASAETQGPAIERYQYLDPRDGDIGAMYTFKTQKEAEVHADKNGVSRFDGMNANDERVAKFEKGAEGWELITPEIEAARHARENLAALNKRFESNIDYALQHPTPAAKDLPAEVREAIETFGRDPDKDMDNKAHAGIEGRNLTFISAGSAAQDAGTSNKIPDELAAKWAKVDAHDLRVIQDANIRQEAITLIAANAAKSFEYNRALAENEPAIASEIAAAQERSAKAENVRMVAEAEARGEIPGKLDMNNPEDREFAEKVKAMEQQPLPEEGKKQEKGAAADPGASQAGQVEELDPFAMAQVAAARKRDFEAASQAKEQPAQQGQAGNAVESDEIFTARNADKTAIPPDVESRYLRAGNKFYDHADKDMKEPVFVDKGNRLETKSNNNDVAENLVKIALARGWDEIKVSGSETFRKEVWMEAAERGMHVKGYTPSEQDKADLAAKQAGKAATVVDKEQPKDKDKDMETFRARENEAKAKQQQAQDTAGAAALGGAAVAAAVLVAHGKARYQNDPKEAMSYYVSTRDSQGKETTKWGVDLERAVKDSGVKVGDKIVIENEGKKAVNIKVPVRDDSGKVIGTEEKTAHRNTWNIARAYENLPPKEAAKQHPELAHAYATEALAKKQVAESGFSPKDQAAINARVRQNMVNTIEKGAIPQVKMRESKEVAKNKDATQKQERHAEQEQTR